MEYCYREPRAKMEFKELCTIIIGLGSEVVDVIQRNRLTAATFLELSSEHLKELFPIVGDRISVTKLLQELKEPLEKAVQ